MLSTRTSHSGPRDSRRTELQWTRNHIFYLKLWNPINVSFVAYVQLVYSIYPSKSPVNPFVLLLGAGSTGRPRNAKTGFSFVAW